MLKGHDYSASLGKASADEQSLSVLNDAYDGALDVENRISREALNKKEF